MTFYNNNYSFKADNYTEVFKVTLSGDQLTMHEIGNKIVEKGEAVVLKSSGNLVMTQTTDDSENGDDNDLKGVSDPSGVTAADPSTTYVLNHTKENGVGFYKLKSGITLGYGKAYLTYPASGAREFIGFGNTTSIQAIDNGQLTIDNVVYDLQGRRVSQPTKGLYIVNGKKVVVK